MGLFLCDIYAENVANSISKTPELSWPPAPPPPPTEKRELLQAEWVLNIDIVPASARKVVSVETAEICAKVTLRLVHIVIMKCK